MLTKTISWRDIDDKPVTEDFHFNVSKADMIELMIEKPELEEKLQGLAANMDGRSIIGLLKEFILLSVGKRPPGSRSFIKTKEILDDFRYSGAYDALLWELANDPPQANKFLENIFSSSLLEEIKKGGSFEDIRKQVEEGKPLNEVIANLPDKDWAAKPAEDRSLTELPKSGNIDTVEGEVVTGAERTPFPESLTEAVAANAQSAGDAKDDRPAWLRELREPTSKELLEMGKDEMAMAFRLREEGKLNVKNKPAS